MVKNLFFPEALLLDIIILLLMETKLIIKINSIMINLIIIIMASKSNLDLIWAHLRNLHQLRLFKIRKCRLRNKKLTKWKDKELIQILLMLSISIQIRMTNQEVILLQVKVMILIVWSVTRLLKHLLTCKTWVHNLKSLTIKMGSSYLQDITFLD